MKRITQALAIVLAMSLLSIVLVACGKNMSDSAYLGKWSATEVSYAGMALSVEEVFGEFTFDLKDNGKCDVTVPDPETGELLTETGSWEEVENGFTVEKEFTVVVDGDTGTMDYDGVTIIFERQ